MALTLSLPALDPRPANPPEIRPAKVFPWLDEILKPAEPRDQGHSVLIGAGGAILAAVLMAAVLAWRKKVGSRQ